MSMLFAGNAQADRTTLNATLPRGFREAERPPSRGSRECRELLFPRILYARLCGRILDPLFKTRIRANRRTTTFTSFTTSPPPISPSPSGTSLPQPCPPLAQVNAERPAIYPGREDG